MKVLDLISKGGVKGIAHVTGGGFTDNIPRVFPKGLGAVINKDSWPVLPVFKWLQEVKRFILALFHSGLLCLPPEWGVIYETY